MCATAAFRSDGAASPGYDAKRHETRRHEGMGTRFRHELQEIADGDSSFILAVMAAAEFRRIRILVRDADSVSTSEWRGFIVARWLGYVQRGICYRSAAGHGLLSLGALVFGATGSPRLG